MKEKNPPSDTKFEIFPNIDLNGPPIEINAVNIDGLCKSFTSEDYKQVKTKMKGAANRKAKTFSVTRLWNHNNLTLSDIKNKY